MIESFLITSRETLEASLVVGIVLAYLNKTKNERYRKSVWAGVGAAILASILVAVLFLVISGSFEGRAEAIFEGSTMLLGAVLLTTMILWMKRQRNVVREIQSDVHERIVEEHPFMSHMGIFALIFVAIIREGVETVIFLNALHYASGISFLAGLLGMIVAIVLGYVCYASFTRINLKHVFNVSSVILILFAAGLVAHGVHEFQEASVLPEVVSPLFDINPAVHPDGSYPLLHENGAIGAFAKGLFGYNGNPGLLEVIAYLMYLSAALVFFYHPRFNASAA